MNTLSASADNPHREVPAATFNGIVMLAVEAALFIAAIMLLVSNARNTQVGLLVLGVVVLFVAILALGGFFSLQPNEAAVLSLFGAYRGTCRTSGLRWINPFYRGNKISVRVRNFNSEKLKVNDKAGNPVEIAAVVVWRVRDTAQAAYDVDSYPNYVTIQSESAVRHVASNYAYDGSRTEVTLLAGGAVVSEALTRELQDRLSTAGVEISEARITHLAYAPEIAQAMLRRQQADAVIAARQKIVAGAVGMVQMALDELAARQVIHLDEERKAAMVSNLLVVLCGESDAQPVLNTGTLYN